MQVHHMTGAGNDFMVIDARGQTLDFADLAVNLCKKTGADGFMAVDVSNVADFRLHFYNADGSRGEMCGNGARCICKYAYDKGIAPAEMKVETDAGLVKGWRLAENHYRVQLNNPSVVDLKRTETCAYVELGNPGVPHGVQALQELTFDMQEQLREKAVALRYHRAFPKGANINFYTRLGENTVRVLTYERGVENYTLACGTGCGSVAVALWLQGDLPGGVLTAHNQGGTLQVTVAGKDSQVESLLLEGPAEYIKIYE